MSTKILLTSSLLTLLVGCGSQPVIWEVSLTQGMKPASCYPDGKLPAMQTTTMGIESSVGPWEIYDGSDNKAYLLLADKMTVYDGTKGDSYNFQGTETTTNTLDPPISVTTTDTKVDTIIFKLSGDTLSGTWETKTSGTCTGNGCMGTIPTCDVTNNIKGAKLAVDRFRAY